MGFLDQVVGPPTSTNRLRDHSLPVAVCLLVGLIMSLLPVAIQWLRTGHAIWIGNGDEAFYLAVGSQAYLNHPTYLSDPALVSGGTSLFRQLPLLPGVWIARMFALGPLGIGICWRIIAGITVGLGWYCLISQFVKNRWVAAALSVVLQVDRGMLGGSLLFRQVQAFVQLLQGDLYLPDDLMYRQWRVASPALTMCYLMLNLLLVTRARVNPSHAALLLSGVSFGLVFYVYPYYWTAAAGALAIAFLLDAGHRRVYVMTAMLGGLLGSYRIFCDVMLKQSTSSDWLHRMGKFVHVPRFTDMMPPIAGSLILVVALVWVWRQRMDAIYLWSMGLSGLILYKHHVLTGLDIENFHWCYVWGPCCSLLLLLVVVSLLPLRERRAHIAFLALMAVALADLVMGLSLRVSETFKSKGGQALVGSCTQYLSQRIESAAPRFVPGATVAGDDDFENFATILENQRPLRNYWVHLSPYVTDEELDDRGALNAYLVGQSREALEAETRGPSPAAADPDQSPHTRDAAADQRHLSRLLHAYDETVKDPEAALDRFGVRYVGLRAGQEQPGYLTSGGWVRLQDVPYWQVWERAVRAQRTTP